MSEDRNTLRVQSSALSDRGLNERRPLNEDAFLDDRARGIFAVADGGFPVKIGAAMMNLLALGLPGGPGEWLLIAGIALLLFGKRLPDVGRSLGKGIVEFKKGIKGVEDDKVYVHFGTKGTACLTTEGKILWTQTGLWWKATGDRSGMTQSSVDCGSPTAHVPLKCCI